MRTLAAVVIAALIAAAAMYATLQQQPEPPRIDAPDTPDPELERLRSQNETLRRRLDQALRQIEELEAREKDREALDSGAIGSSPAAPRTPSIASVTEAHREFDRAIERYDYARLWEIALDLLRFGEPGYEKLIDLFERFEDEIDRNEEFEEFTNAMEELYSGPFLSSISERNGEVLGFALFLQESAPDELPTMIEDFKDDFHDYLPLLLGFQGEADSELLLETVDTLRSQLGGELRNRGRTRDAVRALAHIPLEESTEVLIDLVDRAPSGLLDDVVLSLGLQRNPRAVESLERLLETTDKPSLRRQIEWALRQVDR